MLKENLCIIDLILHDSIEVCFYFLFFKTYIDKSHVNFEPKKVGWKIE